MHLVMQGQGALALSIVDACLHEAGVDLAAAKPESIVWVWLPLSNSDHQDDYTFSRESL